MANPVHGTCDASFARVRELFTEQLANPTELGASVAVTVEGRRVVDLWGGVADAARTRAWTADTLANLFSTTKGMAAICAHRLADAGKLDLDAPVARYWPEFAQADKGAIPVRWLLDHSAGLPAIDAPLPVGAAADWTVMTDALAAQAPWWTPGAEHGYHALTFGWLVGEVVRRVSGRSIGAYFREEVAGPLDADFWIGTPAELDARTAELVMTSPQPGDANLIAEVLSKAKPYGLKAFMNPIPPPGGMNGRAWRAAEIPAANGHGSARARAHLRRARVRNVGRRHLALARGDRPRAHRAAQRARQRDPAARHQVRTRIPDRNRRRADRSKPARVRTFRHGRLVRVRRSRSGTRIRLHDESHGERRIPDRSARDRADERRLRVARVNRSGVERIPR
jgi:CubicO group peptidase (beta-lactamase class C family)